jgi:hypothetical protein
MPMFESLMFITDRGSKLKRMARRNDIAYFSPPGRAKSFVPFTSDRLRDLIINPKLSALPRT